MTITEQLFVGWFLMGVLPVLVFGILYNWHGPAKPSWNHQRIKTPVSQTKTQSKQSNS